MEKNVFLPFEGKRVKLVLKNQFIMYGHVGPVGDDHFVFITKQKQSVLPFSDVLEMKEIDDHWINGVRQ